MGELDGEVAAAVGEDVEEDSRPSCPRLRRSLARARFLSKS